MNKWRICDGCKNERFLLAARQTKPNNSDGFNWKISNSVSIN